MLKQQILFVDDEPMVLQGLQRILRPLRGEWDMVFAESGGRALELMAGHPFDVIVSDMRMPGMNGAELLREVMRRHPTTVRMVLSGHADKDLVTQCVGVAHQYISKPCDPEQLKAMVRNACALAGKLVDDEVKRVIGAIDRLPNVPEVYVELKQALSREESDPRVLGEIIQKDPGMTAKILKLVNSAFFGLRRTINHPQEAVAYLGIDIVKTLVLSNSIFQQSQPFQTRTFGISDVWHHSMAVAAGAKAIAQAEGLDRVLQEEAFVGGILHDVGVLILASNFPDLYNRAVELVTEEHVLLPTAEQEMFGVTHAEVGAYLLGLWGLPAGILKIVSLHHRPHAFESEGMCSAMAVHAADVICGAKGGQALFESGRFNQESLERAGLAGHQDAWAAACASASEKELP
ncbi:MAG: HDOD domain-containing protein [Geothrix sp.]|uniref:response regulator n=1 Tax=Geothrix sp. TaxID=1962974 RepID=UPI0017EF1D0B|nr:response regulator [Geothrix sp.]NWJ39934.1 HDOD domain-containing protein [Geothrix sp.]WIL22054.1 MAG: response regulator [Geothrix sp.]